MNDLGMQNRRQNVRKNLSSNLIKTTLSTIATTLLFHTLGTRQLTFGITALLETTGATLHRNGCIADGIGDSPHVSETVYYNYDAGRNVTVQEGKDNFPLMTPIELSNIFTENSVNLVNIAFFNFNFTPKLEFNLLAFTKTINNYIAYPFTFSSRASLLDSLTASSWSCNPSLDETQLEVVDA